MVDLSLMRRGRAMSFAAAAIAMAFLALAGGAGASSGVASRAPAASRSPVASLGPTSGDHTPARGTGTLSAPLKKGATSYLYAEDGTKPNGVDVYKLSGAKLKHIQHVSGFGSFGGSWFGEHQLALVKKPADCLILASAGDGTLYSLKVNAKTGKLSHPPVSSVKVGADPGDLAVSGSTVFLSDSNPSNSSPTIDVLSVNSGCHLKLQSQNSTGSESDFEYDTDIALANPTTVLSADYYSGDLVAYTLKKNHKLVETVNQPGSFAGGETYGPLGVAVNGKDFYTGDASFSVGPEVQGYSFNGTAFTPLKGSPASSTDKKASDGATIAISAKNHMLIQDDNYSANIGWYDLKGKMSYTKDTPPVSLYATEMTVFGNNLFSASEYGEIVACKVATSKISNCHVAAVVTKGEDGLGGSTVVFTP